MNAVAFQNAELVALDQNELMEVEGGIVPALIAGYIAGVALYAWVSK
ncbi:class IIb bacteriocin, lactobin A/cerein 7B family [Siphonobacter curvatus]|uniref:Class IIb bacteriocin, lactobin A/cerein 7B family n=1 Tax=Siphonobacter curvatus TaxID=2094562 RepID=A0A2S7IH39_9BACT|nr:class IIb bacteriocin, lactobin A/cerein 7B family [Siphonobacter curvatus]PQA55100.1 hypothetical protein C5O19_21400 [Siphonobacter curvatus]